jgi:cytochrome c biogenesis protein CcmG/thiol:disulfide interchange protein DsbE
MKKIIDALPLVAFASLIIVLFSFLSDRDDQLETALIDSSFPEFKLGSLSDESRILTKQDIIKLPALINVWATWCIACRVEHPFFNEIKRGIKTYNIRLKLQR